MPNQQEQEPETCHFRVGCSLSPPVCASLIRGVRPIAPRSGFEVVLKAAPIVSLERIEVTPFAVIAGDILRHRRSGFLTVLAPSTRRVLYWSQGELVMSASPERQESLGEFLVKRGALSAERATEIFGADPNDAVSRLHEAGLLDLSSRQTLMREWLTGQFVPLFSLEEGTAAFTEDEPLAPDRRIFLPSTAGLILEGIRSITNGLVLRRSLGDMKREIRPARDPEHDLDSLPLTEPERAITSSLLEPEPIEAFLRRHSANSGLAAKAVVAMLVIGIYTVVEERRHAEVDAAEVQRDLELLAAIGPDDPRSLRAVSFWKHLPQLDHYQVLDIPRAATRNQVVSAVEARKKQYDPGTYPPAVREAATAIQRRLEEAMTTLGDAARRSAYDALLHSGSTDAASIQQRLMRRSIAHQNVARARELMAENDFYGAIVLLRQAVRYQPDYAEGWYLLGACQERNPRWRRDAAESFQMALSIDPNDSDSLIALGDLYRGEGLLSRAQTCYEDVLKIAPDNPLAKSRLQALKKR